MIGRMPSIDSVRCVDGIQSLDYEIKANPYNLPCKTERGLNSRPPYLRSSPWSSYERLEYGLEIL